MKASAHDETTDTTAEQGRRRRFRFNRKPIEDELAEVDSIVERMDRLHADGTEDPEPSYQSQPQMQASPTQRPAGGDDAVSEAALEALAVLNDRLRSTASAAAAQQIQPQATSADMRYAPNPSAPARPDLEPTVTSTMRDTTASTSDAAVLAPTGRYVPEGIDPMAFASAPAPMPVAAQQTYRAAAEMAPTTAPTSSVVAESSPPPRRDGMLVDVNRIIRTLEEEAESARMRIDHELRNAREEADSIVRSAHGDGDRIRDHAQQQARVLLAEVEEIISESQQTGQQILRKADEESESVRRQATEMLVVAQDEARSIVENARREGEQVLAEQRRLATVRAQEALREQDRLKDQIRRLEERRRQVLESLEPLIDQLSQMIPTSSSRESVDHFGGR